MGSAVLEFSQQNKLSSNDKTISFVYFVYLCSARLSSHLKLHNHRGDLISLRTAPSVMRIH